MRAISVIAKSHHVVKMIYCSTEAEITNGNLSHFTQNCGNYGASRLHSSRTAWFTTKVANSVREFIACICVR
jgi:hypothetical protein